jgi:cyclopropane-fatty-acyl-phospholipid synthase
MNQAMRLATGWMEQGLLPDTVIRRGIRRLCEQRLSDVSAGDCEAASAATEAFVRSMDAAAIAPLPHRANEQHYEVPAEFFALVLGPRRKYSCAWWRDDVADLAQAEDAALAATCEHAALADGQEILELGCGWGSLSLWMAHAYPASRITAVSNSAPQRRHIEARARALGLSNLSVVTADMNAFEPTGGPFDRIVSVEMFEHMANWRALLERARGWLKPDGRLFLHVFTHRDAAYRFDLGDRSDFIAQHFFTGGLMPSHDLPHAFGDLFEVEDEWRWSGEHYRRTADDWLRNMDAHPREVGRAMREVYGADAPLWTRRWRRFFMATAGLFGHAGGTVWGVGHYRLKPAGAV